MAEKKAPPYLQVKAHIDQHFERTGDVPKIRSIKAACGGRGSTETYQRYRDRWIEERQRTPGVEATLLALRNQLHANMSLCQALVDQCFEQIRLEGDAPETAASCPQVSEEEGVCDLDEIDADDRPRSTTVAIEDLPGDEIAELLESRIDEIARESIARFEGSSASEGGHDVPRSDREQDAIRPAGVSGNSRKSKDSNVSLSRSDGGSPQTAFPFGTTSPEKGESDPSESSSNGSA